MLAAMRYSLADLVCGYGSTQAVLNQKLAWFLECDATRLQALNGAAQVFPILRRLWADRPVTIPSPTFGEYTAAFPGARLYPDAPGTATSVSDLEHLAQEGGVVVIVNPNNPTGTTLSSASLHRLAARHPETTFLVDESFIAFSGQGSMLQQLEAKELANVVVLCSLSKTLGVPGLRIGYVYSTDAGLLRDLGAEIPIWNMNAVAEYFVELLLKFRPQLAESLAQTERDRAAFSHALSGAPPVARVHPSGGNFVLVDLHGAADVASRLHQALLTQEAISVKDVTERFSDRVPRLRLAVRRPQENDRLVHALTALSESQLAGLP
jgi:histidinol-phosphate/aromatic aminotransferase/cobyric acid decarboxylase-like protein